MKEMKYFAPQGVGEALNYLAEYGEKATVLAGGTDVVPKVNYYELLPDVILHVGGIGTDYIKEEDGHLVIGAGATWSSLIANPLVKARARVLAEAAAKGGCVATRNAGTIGGNIVNASPAADLSVALLALDAEVVVRSSKAERTVALEDFFTGPGATVLQPNELVIEVHVPFVKGNAVFLKLGRRKAMTLSVVNTAVHIQSKGRTCEEARIAVGAMGPTPIRCVEAEKVLVGQAIDLDLIAKCADTAITKTSPIDDNRASAWYRKKAGRNLIRRALVQAAGIAG
jgi:CO/xanthine dehydrogenase FAD-binding subunit